jgi:NACHT domain
MTGLEPIWISAGAKGLTDLVIKPISEVLNQRLDEPFNQFLFNFFRRYIQNYSDRHGLLKVLGMLEPVKLEDIYTSAQFLRQRDLWLFDPSGLEESYRKTQKRRFQSEQCEKKDGLKVANDNRYLMVLGQPGAGKSTFLRRIGLEALKGEYGNYQHRCVPVFLELKRFTTGDVDLVKTIADEFAICGFPNPQPTTQKLLDQGKLLILLDGLDEVPTQQLDHAITQIQDFADQYKQNRFIASCRTAAYQSGFRKFVDVMMSDFDDDQIRQFIRNWFCAEKDKESMTAERCWDLLQQPAHDATKELAQTPLLLTLLCLVFDDTQNFPEKRAELYKQALDVLLTKWAAEKRIQRDPIYKDLTLTLETIMLGEIAYGGFEADRLFFSQREVVEQIRTFLASNLNVPSHLDGDVILQAIQVQQGILVERAKDVFSFSHLTLQEYLTAQHIADHAWIEQLVQNHLTDQRWREVFLLVAGVMRPSADDLLRQIEHQAKTCINTPTLQALIRWADQNTQNSDNNFNAATKRVVAVFLLLSLSRALSLDRALDRALSRDLGLDQSLNRSLDFALSLALSLGLSHALFLDLGLSRALNLDLSRDRALILALDLPLTLDLDLSRALDLSHAFEKTKILKTVNFSRLTVQLETLKTQLLDNLQRYKNYSAFADQIFPIWCNALYLKTEWLDLSEAEINALSDYFYANELMVRCKESAVRVSPKVWAEIESRMLTVHEQ